jgi:hypothetical protein
MQAGDSRMMSFYQSKILAEFSTGKYAEPVSQPDFEWNFRHMAGLQDSLYNEAYKAYQQGDVDVVRHNYQSMKKKFPFTDLMPNFTLLNALTYAQTRDAYNLEASLTEMVEKYPKSEVTPLATEILDRVKAGKILLSDGTPITDFDWSKAYESGESSAESQSKALQYTDTLDSPYILLLMFKPNTIDRNELLYEVADYNFSNYVIQTFDLSFESDPPYNILQIKGFESFNSIRAYLIRAYNGGGLMQHLDTSIVVLPISTDNYINVLPRLGLEKYMAYFSENFAEQFPQLIASWNEVVYEPIAEPITQKTDDVDNIQPMEDPKIETPVIEPSVTAEKQEEDQSGKPADNKQINADDLLTKDQLQKAGQINKVVENIEDVVNNPVDGIKNLFNNYKNGEKLTKEEKEARKIEEKQRKEQEKNQKAIQKARQDSIKKIEKARTDAIVKAEKAEEDSINNVKKQAEDQRRLEEKQKENAAQAALKARENRYKEKEDERKDRERLQKERFRQQEKERKEKEKAKEKERKEKEKIREQERKEKERQAEEKRKQLLKERSKK